MVASEAKFIWWCEKNVCSAPTLFCIHFFSLFICTIILVSIHYTFDCFSMTSKILLKIYRLKLYYCFHKNFILYFYSLAVCNVWCVDAQFLSLNIEKLYCIESCVMHFQHHLSIYTHIVWNKKCETWNSFKPWIHENGWYVSTRDEREREQASEFKCINKYQFHHESVKVNLNWIFRAIFGIFPWGFFFL
jgi:hypothetical protein